MNAILPIGAGIGLLLLLVGGKKAGAATPAQPTTYPTAPAGSVPSPTTKPVAQRMAEVLATRDPNAIRFEAARLRQEGYPDQAAQLEAAATQLEQQIAAGQAPAPTYPTPASPAAVPGVSLPPSVTIPPVTIPGVGTTPQVTLPPAVQIPGVGTVQLPTELPPLPPIVDPTGPNPTVTIPPLNIPGVGTTPPLTIPLPPVGAPPSSTPPVATPATSSPAPKAAPAPAAAPKAAPAAATPAAPVLTAADWVSRVPPALQGVTLKAATPAAYDTRALLWQQRLAALGYPLGASGVDGKYGADTSLATRLFQTANAIGVDGIAGPQTFAKAVGSPVRMPAVSNPSKATGAVLAALELQAAAKAATAAKAPAPAPAAKPAAAPSPVPAALQGVTLRRTSPAVYDARTLLWQQQLAKLGFPAGTDGMFGPTVEAATKAFQKSRGLAQDGIVGAQTLAAAFAPGGGVKLSGDEEFGRDSVQLRAPPQPLPASPIPGMLPAELPPEPRPELALASRVTLMLMGAPTGGEDRTLVALFQSREGLKPTGLYGPKTGELLALRYGIVPPRPRYWGDRHNAKAKQLWRDLMLSLAAQDPQREEEWRRAA